MPLNSKTKRHYFEQGDKTSKKWNTIKRVHKRGQQIRAEAHLRGSAGPTCHLLTTGPTPAELMLLYSYLQHTRIASARAAELMSWQSNLQYTHIACASAYELMPMYTYLQHTHIAYARAKGKKLAVPAWQRCANSVMLTTAQLK